MLLIGVGGQTRAFGFDVDGLSIHGFAGQGYIKSSDNNYFGYSEDSSYEFNEIGINFMLPATDDLRLGIQVFSRDLGQYGNNDLTLDWALIDYYWTSWLGFRAGKVKMPFGLFNRSRDVDNLRTSAILNQAVYIEGIRDLVIAFYGFNVYGSKTLGVLGSINYDLFTGTLDVPNDSPWVVGFFNRMKYADKKLGVFASMMDLSDLTINIKHFEGGQLLWNTPIPGLVLSATDFFGKSNAKFGAIPGEAKLKEFSVLSARYDFKDFTFIFERTKADIEFRMLGLPEIPGLNWDGKMTSQFEGWYGEIAWRVTRWLDLGASYGEFYPDSNDKNGHIIDSGDEAQRLPDYYAWQKDTTLSTKFNINEYLCIKFETHFIDGLGNTDLSDYSPGEMKKHWNLYVLKTSINI